MMKLEKTLDSGITVRADAEHMAILEQIETDMYHQRENWEKWLRHLGVKAAHPDDGWVRRYNPSSDLAGRATPGEFESVHWAYPYFRKDLEPGDLIALGWPHKASDTRLVIFDHTTSYQLQFPQRGPWSWHFVNVFKQPDKGGDLIGEHQADVLLNPENMVIKDKRDGGDFTMRRMATANEIVAARILTPAAEKNREKAKRTLLDWFKR